MIAKFKHLRLTYQIGFLTLALTIVSFLATLFLIYQRRADIPLGLLFGGIVFSVLSFLQGFGEHLDDAKGNNSMVYTLVMMVLRFIVIITLPILIAFMYYRWNAPYFNIFSFVGIYTAKLLITVLVYLLDKRGNNA